MTNAERSTTHQVWRLSMTGRSPVDLLRRAPLAQEPRRQPTVSPPPRQLLRSISTVPLLTSCVSQISRISTMDPPLPLLARHAASVQADYFNSQSVASPLPINSPVQDSPANAGADSRNVKGTGAELDRTPRANGAGMDEGKTSQSTSKKRKRNSASIGPVPPDVAHDQSFGDSSQVHSLSEIDAIILQKRKPREKTSCHPCRKRKVGCDRRLPCQTCIDRRHPEVCVYESSNDHASFVGAGNLQHHQPSFSTGSDGGMGPTGFGEQVTIPRDYLDRLMMKIDGLETTLLQLTSDVRALSSGSTVSYPRSPMVERRISSHPQGAEEEGRASAEGLHTRNTLTGQTVHVGSNSIPALVMALAKKHNDTLGNSNAPDDPVDWQELMGGSVLPLFGLDNESATYPFVDLWSHSGGPMSRIQQLSEALPSEQECKINFAAYRDHAHIVYPGIVDIQKFEEELHEFHIQRARDGRTGGLSEQSMYGKHLSWISLLFAAMAAGVQCSDLPRKSRELTAKVFVCCAFECLRLHNFLSSTTIESIQALLVFGNVIANMYNAGVAWAMLGLNIRLSQALGLHKDCPPGTPYAIKNERSKVWWAVLWQDSLLSITYDRASSSSSLDGPSHFPPDADSPHGPWSFEACMYRLCLVGLDIVKDRHNQLDPYATLYRMEHHEQSLNDLVGRELVM
jgi:hypothetical protein